MWSPTPSTTVGSIEGKWLDLSADAGIHDAYREPWKDEAYPKFESFRIMRASLRASQKLMIDPAVWELSTSTLMRHWPTYECFGEWDKPSSMGIDINDSWKTCEEYLGGYWDSC